MVGIWDVFTIQLILTGRRHQTMKLTYSVVRLFALIFALLAIAGASNPIEERGLRQGGTSNQPSEQLNSQIDLKSFLVTFSHPDTPDR